MQLETEKIPDIFHFFEMTPDLVCIAGKDGYFKNINAAVSEILGYSKQELLARPIHSFIYEEDREITHNSRASLLEGKALINFENRYVTKQGDIVWLQWTSIYFPDKEIVFAIAKDITERKLKEREIEERYKTFKGLASYFKTSLEKDKKDLANELHEDLAQMASVVKMDINWLAVHAPALDDASKTRLQHAQQVLDLLINSMRRISFTISPNMLDDVGLNETLKWLCDEYTRSTETPCFFESSFDDANLSHENQLDLFRICQEVLNCMIEDAHVNAIRIFLKPGNNKVCLTIAIEGDSLRVRQIDKTPGFENIRKRVDSVHGTISLDEEQANAIEICITH